MPLFRSKAEDKVREAGFDPARLPPGQYYTDKWPVLHASEVPQVDLATWTLQVTGEVEDLLKAGIGDPTMVTRSALQNAASIAKNILTTEAVVAEAPEKAGAGVGGGMPDMGGMM